MSDTPKPTAHDTDYFTDADQLQPPADVVQPEVNDPDQAPPTVDPVDGHASAYATGAPPLAGDSAGLAASVQSALDGDAAGLHALDRLTQSGRLTASPGLLENLASFATTARDPRLVLEGIGPSLLLSQVVRALDNPLRVQQGAARGTCGAASLQYMLVRRHPDEFVRLADGLTRYGGEVEMRSGAKLTLPVTAIKRDTGGRVDMDRLFQSALMNRGTLMHWLFDYDNTKDDNSFWAQLKGDTQMPCGGLGNVWAELTGEELTAKTSVLTGREDLAAEVASLIGQSGLIPVLLAWSSDTSYHFVVAERVEHGPGGPVKVYLRNPWGEDNGAGRPRRTALPGGGGRVAMAFSDFASILAGAAMPA